MPHEAPGEAIPLQAGYRGLNYSDPFGLFDITVQGDQAKAIVTYLLEHSETFRDIYNKLDADHNVHITIRAADPSNDAEYYGKASQFKAAKSGDPSLVFYNPNLMNGANMALIKKGSKWIHTAASVVGHELVHAAGHYGVSGVPRSCAEDPPAGGTGCVVDYENKIRHDLPPSARGGTRTVY